MISGVRGATHYFRQGPDHLGYKTYRQIFSSTGFTRRRTVTFKRSIYSWGVIAKTKVFTGKIDKAYAVCSSRDHN
ncbi:hypothetical protein [Nonomuraea sp. 10N515B]|uniref:hypothetical protein n=1 Tax=Nonomuraea sp. 10N515B TaxID=3457422 RepID=UPI003FCDCD67